MGISLDDSTTERCGGFTVAGVGQHSDRIDASRLWASLDEYADDLAPHAVDEDRYGVLFDMDAKTDEFTYVAGRRVDSTDDLPAELTAVEVPEAAYTVFTPTDGSINAVVESIEEQEFGDGGRVNGPMFERYTPAEDPTDPDAALELYVPVETY